MNEDLCDIYFRFYLKSEYPNDYRFFKLDIFINIYIYLASFFKERIVCKYLLKNNNKIMKYYKKLQIFLLYLKVNFADLDQKLF